MKIMMMLMLSRRFGPPSAGNWSGDNSEVHPSMDEHRGRPTEGKDEDDNDGACASPSLNLTKLTCTYNYILRGRRRRGVREVVAAAREKAGNPKRDMDVKRVK